MNKLYRLLFITLFIIISLDYCFCSENYVFAQTDPTASKLQMANNAINKAFNTVLDAEKAGGNVTQLLVKLNIAGMLLAEAQNALNNGNTANITSKVENARQIATQVNGEALNLRDFSLFESQNSFWLTVSFSVVGAAAFGFSLFIVWHRFKCFYIKKLFGAKPEVVENEP
jgi:hypothetical protein